MSAWGQEVEADLRWREAELAALKTLCAKSSGDSQRAVLRALWAMMYAHYEGFHKFCWDLLLDGVQREGLVRGAVSDTFAKLSLVSVFKKFRGDTSPDGIWDFVRTQMAIEMGALASFPDKLETQSNLWPNVARDNNLKVNISCGYLDSHETKLKLIVSRRNEIAHGKKLVVEKLSEYQEYENSALLVMHELALAVIDCLDKKSYLAFPALPPPGGPA